MSRDMSFNIANVIFVNTLHFLTNFFFFFFFFSIDYGSIWDKNGKKWREKGVFWKDNHKFVLELNYQLPLHTCAIFLKSSYFSPPDRYTYLCISGGKKNNFFWKILSIYGSGKIFEVSTKDIPKKDNWSEKSTL